MKVAREKNIQIILNPAPAIPLPEDAYKGLDHLIVNETEASILSGIENPTSWDDVASVFVNRGVQNVIITLGAEVRLQISPMFIHLTHSGRILPNR
jgi:ribokinase